MPDTEKALRLKILQAKLERSELQVEEARLERMQRAMAVRDQEEESEFNRQRRESLQKDTESKHFLDHEWRRPSMYLGTDVYFDDDAESWACQHGYVTAFGDTPEMACDNFDHLWVFGEWKD